MFLLYASKEKGDPVSQDLVATFDSEEQLRAYVQWATLRKRSEGMHDFEQGSVLAGYQRWGLEERPGDARGVEVSPEVVHNPSPTML